MVNLLLALTIASCQKKKEEAKNLIIVEKSVNKVQWWKDAKYGMFIHWGLYSKLAGEYNGKITPAITEWIQNTLKILLSDYKKLMHDFNPEKLNLLKKASTR